MATVSFHDKTPSATRLQSLWLATFSEYSIGYCFRFLLELVSS